MFQFLKFQKSPLFSAIVFILNNTQTVKSFASNESSMHTLFQKKRKKKKRSAIEVRIGKVSYINLHPVKNIQKG